MDTKEARIAQLERRRTELLYRISQWDGTWMRATTLTRTSADYQRHQVEPERQELVRVEAELKSLGWAEPLKASDYLVFAIVFGILFGVISEIYWALR